VAGVNGELAQAIALAAHGNVWLRNGSGPPPDLVSSSTFEYVQSIGFVLDGTEVAGAVAEWFEDLRVRGVRRLWLDIPDESHGGRWLADHLASAFAGGGRWVVLASADSFAETWQPQWRVDQSAPDGRIWQVAYVGRGPALVFPSAPAIDDAAASLRGTLIAARDFADRNLPDFAESFARALGALERREPGPSYYRDLLPASYPPTSQALVAASAHAWVFGGMGSWNDAGFSDESVTRQYEDLSRRLWQSITTALVAAVNVDLDAQAPGTTTPAS